MPTLAAARDAACSRTRVTPYAGRSEPILTNSRRPPSSVATKFWLVRPSPSCSSAATSPVDWIVGVPRSAQQGSEAARSAIELT
eukprot:5133450-Prymnesium_polylepis.1